MLVMSLCSLGDMDKLCFLCDLKYRLLNGNLFLIFFPVVFQYFMTPVLFFSV